MDVICTMEDHALANGFGCGIMEHLSEAHITTPVVRVGWPDQFIEHGSVPILREKYGMTAKAAVEKIRPFIRNRAAVDVPHSAA